MAELSHLVVPGFRAIAARVVTMIRVMVLAPLASGYTAGVTWHL